MNLENLSKIVSLFNIAAIRAGEKIMENYKSSNYEVKHDGSPVTIADLEANKVITEILSSEIADIKIVSEENEELNDSEKYFLIDPLDGTKEFISKNGEFTVNIALIIGGKPVIGSVYLPFKKELFWNDEKNSTCGRFYFCFKIFIWFFKTLSSIFNTRDTWKNIYKIIPL